MEYINFLVKLKLGVLVVLLILLFVLAVYIVVLSIKEKESAKKVKWLYQNGFVEVNGIWLNKRTMQKITCDKVRKLSYRKLTILVNTFFR